MFTAPTPKKPSVSEALEQAQSASRKIEQRAEDSVDIFDQIAAMITELKTAHSKFTG